MDRLDELAVLAAVLDTGSLAETSKGKQGNKGFLPKGAITWTPSENFMAYGLIDKGYRFGGPNLSLSPTVPASFSPDSLINYELGERSTLLDGRLQLDASLFYIDWSRIQLQFETPQDFSYVANGGKARSYGFEGNSTWAIVPNLTLQTNLTYLNATLSDDYNPGSGGAIISKGTTLPGASKWQVSNLLSYQWLNGPLTPVFSVSQRYISKAPGVFEGGARQGGYNLFDARSSFYLGRYELSAFVENIGNSHGVTTGDLAQGGIPRREYIVRPFTAGATFDVYF